jgi:hypothetical protein
MNFDADFIVQAQVDTSRLVPLTPVVVPSSAASLKIHCAQCYATLAYEPARVAGWTFDPHGVAFHDFYCGGCSHG